MELDPELSLAPTKFFNANKSGTTSSTTNNIISSRLQPEINYSSRKRKLFHHHHVMKTQPPVHQAGDDHVDLHLKDPLPLDWEQCLDLEVISLTLSLFIYIYCFWEGFSYFDSWMFGMYIAVRENVLSKQENLEKELELANGQESTRPGAQQHNPPAL